MKTLSEYRLLIKSVTFVIYIGLLSSCGETEKKTDTNALPVEAPKVIADTVDVAILPFDTSMTRVTDFPKNLEAAPLNEVELRLVDSLMAELVSTYNTNLTKNQQAGKQADSLTSAMNLKDYKKQYIAVINARGETEVWVNCFCKAIEKRVEFVDWKKIPVKVIDGGNCFFNVRVNLAQRKTYNLKVNSNG